MRLRGSIDTCTSVLCVFVYRFAFVHVVSRSLFAYVFDYTGKYVSLSDYIRAGCPGMCVCVCVGDGELWLLYLCVYDVSLGVCVFAHIKV